MWGCWPEVLGDEQAGSVEGGLAIGIQRAHDELGPVDVVQAAARPRRTPLEMVQGAGVVVGGDEVVEDDAVGDLAGQLHHLHAGGTDVDRHVLGSPLLVDVVELDAVEVDVGAVEGDGLVVQQGAHDGDDLAHHGQRVITDDPHLAGQRVPPCARARR